MTAIIQKSEGKTPRPAKKFELSDSLATAFTPAELEEMAARFAEAQKSISSVLEETVRASAPLLAGLQNLVNTAAPYAEQIKATLEKWGPKLVALKQAINQMPEQERRVLRTLATHGWYLDGNMFPDDVFERVAEFESGRDEQAHVALCAHFDSSLGEIEHALCEENPARGRFLHAAFSSHRRGDFASAIPLCLAQADGICSGLTGQQLYAKEKGMPKLAGRLSVTQAEPLTASLLVALVEPAPISANTKELRGVTGSFNRHAVMHGESLDYDSRLNSCRAISLLVYVNWVLRKRDVATILKSQSCDQAGETKTKTKRERRNT